MGNEASKARPRLERYLKGSIIDIGAGSDPVVPQAKAWDQKDGDAQLMDNVPDEAYDTVFSSHCLEHMRNPLEALMNWWRILKPGGHLIVLVPDEDLYEQHQWPSTFNDDHKWAYTPHKDGSWCPASTNVLDLMRHLHRHKLISLRVVDDGYEYGVGRKDQTQGNAEAEIELILYKQTIPDGAWDSPFNPAIFCPQCKGVVVAHGIKGMEMRGRCLKCGALIGINLNAIDAARK